MKKSMLGAAALFTLGSSLAVAQQGKQPPQPMSFFITSSGSGKGADLGGIAGADARCQTLASAAGSSFTWHAYMSTQAKGGQPAVNARDRIGDGPWFGAKSNRIAQNVGDLHGDTLDQARVGNALSKASAYTEKGDAVKGAGDTPNPGQLGAYSARWLASAPALVPQGGEATFGPLSYTMVRDDLYGNGMPRLTRAPKGVRIDAVNAALEKLHRALVLRDRNCAQNLRSSTALTDPARLAAIEKPAGKGERGAQESIKPVFASASLLTLYETRSQFCGGAHPTNSVAAFTFDLANPRQLAGLGDGGDDLGSSGLGSALDVADPAKRTRFDALWVARFRAAIAADREAHPGDETAEACGSDLDSQLEQSGAGIGKLIYPVKDGLASTPAISARPPASAPAATPPTRW